MNKYVMTGYSFLFVVLFSRFAGVVGQTPATRERGTN